MGRIADVHGKAPRVLVYDIETRPMVSMHWQAYGDQSFSPEQVLDSGGVLCWAAKWLGESKVHYMGDHHDGHAATVAGLWRMLDEASIVIGYNQIRFDDKRMAREFLLADMPLPTPVQSIDLLRAVKARFGFPINKLQHVAGELGIGSKVPHTGWGMWRACVLDGNGQPYLGPVPVGGGNERQWNLMRRYCRHDVALTERVYHRLRPYIKNHPHMGQHGADPGCCPNCGGTLEPNGLHRSTTLTYGRLVCVDCGAHARDTKAVKGTATTSRGIA